MLLTQRAELRHSRNGRCPFGTDSDQVRAQRVGPPEPPEQARRPVSIVQFGGTYLNIPRHIFVEQC